MPVSKSYLQMFMFSLKSDEVVYPNLLRHWYLAALSINCLNHLHKLFLSVVIVIGYLRLAKKFILPWRIAYVTAWRKCSILTFDVCFISHKFRFLRYMYIYKRQLTNFCQIFYKTYTIVFSHFTQLQSEMRYSFRKYNFLNFWYDCTESHSRDIWNYQVNRTTIIHSSK